MADGFVLGGRSRALAAWLAAGSFYAIEASRLMGLGDTGGQAALAPRAPTRAVAPLLAGVAEVS